MNSVRPETGTIEMATPEAGALSSVAPETGTIETATPEAGALKSAPPETGAIAIEPPEAGTVERWAFEYVLSESLEHKLAPPPVPSRWAGSAPARRIEKPGRPLEIRVVLHAPKAPGPEAMRAPHKRAQLVHTFLHHELQATELMAWAVLAFPETPRAFRGGLLHIALDEVRHMGLYARQLTELGYRFGDFPVRDWFWERVPSARTPAEFVAVVGVGLEGANLDHTKRFAERFRAIGDEAGARVQEQVGEEEIPHVRFARRWLKRWTGSDDFATWTRHLPPPLSPILMRGKPLDREARLRAGLSEPFLSELSAWTEAAKPPGS